MSKEIRILIVEDVATDVVRINHELRVRGLSFRSKRVETRADFLHELQHHPPDLILSDHGLPSFDGFTALAIAQDQCPEVPFIFVTGALGEQFAIEAIRSGATDYVLKDHLESLAPAVERAVRQAQFQARFRETESQVHEREEQFRLVMEGVKDYAISMLDTEGRVTFWNAGAQWISGWRPEEIQGRHFSLFYPDQEVADGKPRQALKIAAAEGRLAEEGLRVGKGGKTFMAEVAITSARDGRGKLRGYTHVLRDITRQKETEQRLLQLNEALVQQIAQRTAELAASNKVLETLNHSIAHELREPLLRIKGCAELLQNQGTPQLDELGRARVQAITESAQQMSRLMRALLQPA